MRVLENSTMTANTTVDDTSEDVDYYDVKQAIYFYFKNPYQAIAVVIIGAVIISNFFSLMAIRHTRGKMTSHFRLLVSLAIADIFVASSAFINKMCVVAVLQYSPGVGPADGRLKSRCIYVVLKAMNTVGLNITLLNLMGMAVDLYIAILRPLHHTRIMNGRNTSMMILCLWIIAFITGFSDFFCPVWEYSDFVKYRYKFNYCEFVHLSKYQEEYTVFAIAFICLITMVVMYGRIYARVWKHQMSRNNTSQQNSSRSRKTLITTLLILGTFILCWLPTCAFNVTLMIIFRDKNLARAQSPALMNGLSTAEKYLFNLLLLNGVCDPFIYAVRIREIQIGYRIMYSRCCSFVLPRTKYSRNSLTRDRPSSFGMTTMADDKPRQKRNSFRFTSLIVQEDAKLGQRVSNTTSTTEMYA